MIRRPSPAILLFSAACRADARLLNIRHGKIQDFRWPCQDNRRTIRDVGSLSTLGRTELCLLSGRKRPSESNGSTHANLSPWWTHEPGVCSVSPERNL